MLRFRYMLALALVVMIAAKIEGLRATALFAPINVALEQANHR